MTQHYNSAFVLFSACVFVPVFPNIFTGNHNSLSTIANGASTIRRIVFRMDDIPSQKDVQMLNAAAMLFMNALSDHTDGRNNNAVLGSRRLQKLRSERQSWRAPLKSRMPL